MADTVTRGGGLSFGLLGGQDVFTVATMHDKLDVQLRGLGAGFVPDCMARPFMQTGRLVVKAVERPKRLVSIHYAWRDAGRTPLGRAMQWWLTQLESPATRVALLAHHRGV